FHIKQTPNYTAKFETWSSHLFQTCEGINAFSAKLLRKYGPYEPVGTFSSQTQAPFRDDLYA
ncbi:MAG: hypothetical protein PHS86_08655, partial [Syntrophaceae bacterium]|nr:hypothetical protein [Syntrophaceae bacterium]